MSKIILHISLMAAIVLPLWNIPLILNIVRRRSSKDISMSWAMGVWVCSLLMAPAGLMSADLVWRCFNIVNLTLFTGVIIVVWKYRG
ncbi:MAG: hypothetical protein HQL13_07460 [Candidatus Omnitrophica bacterium]|nr:hypothetical protein [Candidatus Omnitrophota bacterium]